MSATMNDLHAVGLNPFAVQLLAESMLKSVYVKHCGTQPLTFNYPAQREDCAGWIGVRITIEAVSVDGQPQAEAVPAAHPECDCGREGIHEMHRPGCAHAKSKVAEAVSKADARYRAHIESEWRRLNHQQDEAVPPTQAALDVLAERQRQISSEGWTPEHDDEYGTGALAAAAASYALSASATHAVNAYWNEKLQGGALNFWPWDREWWKPSDQRRNLVKAGALILAEIERLDRAAIAQQKASAT